MPEASFTSTIEASVDQVWAFHASDDALERLTPPGAATVLRRDPGLAVGVEVLVRVRLAPLVSQQWLARHVVCEPPFRFVDEMVTGPMAFWRHEHRFTACGEQCTEIRDAITWRHHWWQLPPCANWYTRRKLAGLFAYRHAQTKHACVPASPD